MGRRNKTSQQKVHSNSRSDDTSEEEKHATFEKRIAEQLQLLNLCSSQDEYSSVSEAIASLAPVDTSPSEDDMNNVIDALLDYFVDDVKEENAKALVYAAAYGAWYRDLDWITDRIDDGGSDSSVSERGEEDDAISDEYGEIDDDDGDFIGEGECELCERSIKLTRHHLIPKSTWPRMKKRLWDAASVIESLHSVSANETPDQKVEEMKHVLECKLGTSDLSYLPTNFTHDTVRAHLSQVCLLCRMCHSAVHRVHTEWELAMEYNTMERLLECEEVMKFGRWANKQRPGKYAN
eukprot:CAMPEP_0183723048 /NCGR_PEP_ID=MMETSP0737-20130205/14785_1 /TAXON_ID=385413 /ORGANISM="Thalassiosira miniscula, Strain CCMP1093" /LENGTH=292 /DNA_ID=CAMNT_0025953299 /DNA_START=403 /DNA_END=1281 /DNA_ORIENTATION=+